MTIKCFVKNNDKNDQISSQNIIILDFTMTGIVKGVTLLSISTFNGIWMLFFFFSLFINMFELIHAKYVLSI